MSANNRRRPYRKTRRAEQEDATRLRITEAAVALHGSVGPAQTTISAIAERAGVQRATVYRHFPTESDLFGACSAHWGALNPPPDPSEWAGIVDPSERLRLALDRLYSWYEGTAYMLERASRDAAIVEALQPAVERRMAYVEGARASLLRGRPERGNARRRTSAAIGHALSFETWNSLTREQGLGRDDAVALMTATVVAARG